MEEEIKLPSFLYTKGTETIWENIKFVHLKTPSSTYAFIRYLKATNQWKTTIGLIPKK